MPDDQSSNEDNIEFSIQLEPDGTTRLSGKVPVTLATNAGASFKKAFEVGVAGLFPNRYERTIDTLLRTEVKKAIIKAALGVNIENQEAVQYVANLSTQLLSEQDQKQRRRFSVIQYSIEHLAELFNSHEEDSDEIISDEFLFHFWNIADKIPEDELRKTYSRILAKEILSPNSISASTLHLLTTLHPELARKFELLCSMTFSWEEMDFVIISMPDDVRPATSVNSVSSSIKKGEQLTTFGLSREDLLELRSTGLIRSMPEEEFPDLTGFFALANIDFAGRNVRLDVSADTSTKEGFAATDSTNIVSLTRPGSELRTILALEPHPVYAKRLIDTVMPKAAVKLTYL